MKKIFTTFVLGTLFFSFSPTPHASADITCGEWNDVPSSYMEVLTTVCEYGLMQGYNEDQYGYGRDLIRADIATIGNRIAMGTDDYADKELGQDLDDSYYQLTSVYSDIPNPYDNASYEWIVQAMYFAVMDNQIMSGDDGDWPHTLRPTDSINIVETFKILFESAKKGDVLESDVENTDITYDSDPWWEELMYKMENEGVILHLDTDYQSFWVDGAITRSYTDFGSDVEREDAAIFLYNMIQDGLIDGELLEERISSDNGYDLAVTDIYLGSTEETLNSVYVEVSNLGDEEIDIDADLNLQLYVNDDEPFQAIYAADLAEEDEDWLTPGGTSTFGPYDFSFMDDGTGVEADGNITSIRAWIDQDDVIDESNENNNWDDLELYY